MKLHFIVTGKEFLYPYYLAVLTGMKTQNVDGTILWLTSDIVSPYLDLLKNKVEIKKIDCPKFPALYGQQEYFVRAHTKDYLAYKILYEYGGICMDLDTISLQDISTLLGDKDMVIPSDAENPGNFLYHYNSAILVAKKSSPLLKEAVEKAYEILNKGEAFSWGTTGPILISNIANKNKDKIFTPAFGVCGGLGGYESLKIYKEHFKFELDPSVRILHLFAVHSNKNGKLFDKITPEFIEKSDSLLARTVRKILPEKEWKFKNMKLHFIVTGKEFPYPYCLAVLSGMRTQNVDGTILWLTDDITSPYLDFLRDKVEIKKIKVPEFPALAGQPDYFVKAHTKDYLAYKILYEQGGICMDLDTFSVGDITCFLGDKEAVVPLHKKIDPDSVYNWNSAILVGKKGSLIFKEAVETALEKLNQPKSFIWGTTGPILISEIVSRNREKVFTPGLMACGGLIDYNVTYLYEENEQVELDPECRIIHLYAVASNRQGNFFNNITPDFIRKSNSLLARMVKVILPEDWDVFSSKSNEFTLSNIPENAFPLHFTVTGDSFSYLYYISVLTAIKVQKTTSTIIWCVKDIKSKYLDILIRKYGVQIKRIEVPVLPALSGKPDGFVMAHVKDFVAYNVLYNNGGVYLDLDTISISDVSELLGDKELVVPTDAENPNDFKYHYNGAILIAKKKTPLLLEAINTAIEKFNKPDGFEWGMTGPILISEIVFKNVDKIVLPEFGVCGGYTGYGIVNFYKNNYPLELNSKIRVVHLFAQASNKQGNWYNNVTLDSIKNGNSLLARTVRLLLKEEEWNPNMEEKFFVEIGSNYFDTLVNLAKEGWKGVVVEPVPEYFNKIERVEGVTYLNAAIGNENGKLPFYYIREEDIKANNLPDWARGIGSLSPQHRDIVANHWQYLLYREVVPVFSVQSFLETMKIEKIDYLKIDTEGMDCEILKQFDISKIDKITFEYKHCTKEERDREFKRLFDNGFVYNINGDNVDAEKKNSSDVIISHGVPEHFRFHLLGMVHLPQSREYMSCAFTQKNRKLAKMLTSLGHEVFFYGSEGSDVEEYCNSDKLHFVQTHTLKDICDSWGDGDNRFEIGYDWHSTDYRHDFNSDKKPATLKFYKNVIEYINANKKPDDFFLNTMGYYYKAVEDEVKLFLSCESGIGYRGSYGGHYRAFESSSVQNFSYGSGSPGQDINGSFYDRVIPNYFDPADFEYSDQKSDYYLYIGRMIKRKGILTAALACEAIGAKLIIAGQGASVRENGHLIPNDHNDFDLAPSTWEYVGYKGVDERKGLMAHAIALFVPTEYMEIFGGTHIEGMLSGTPPITTNFGCFPGTIPDCVNGIIGFRCNTLNDFAEAAIAAKKANPKWIRNYGERFLMDNVKLEYQRWFTDLYHLWLSAVYPGVERGWHWLPEKIENYPLTK